MLGPIIVFVLILAIAWYIKSWRHPNDFPPGPRLPFPLVGDGYLLGTKLSNGCSSLVRKYGKTVGLWLGPTRTVLITDFDTLQDILNLPETAAREAPLEVGGKFLKSNVFDTAFILPIYIPSTG